MSKRSITINVSDSKSIIGTVSQGNNVDISSASQNMIPERGAYFDDFYSEIARHKVNGLVRINEIEELKLEIESLQSALKNNNNEKSDNLIKKAKWLYETYGWAAVPLKKLFDTLFPGCVS